MTFSTAVFAAPTFINILTGGTSGVYYPIGVGLSQIYGHDIQGAKTSVQATKASVENLNLLQAGRGELALALGDSVADAWNGVADAGFKAPLKKLRAIGNTYPNYIQVVASQASGIKTLADLKGKRISVGAPKSGTELNARAIFKAAGLSYEDMGKVEYLPYAESVELIKNRQLDATLQSSGLGMAAIRDLASTMPITFVAIPADVVAKIDSPAYHAASIPAGTYDGQGAGRADGGDRQYPGQPLRGQRRAGLPDDQADVRQPAAPGHRPCCRQGHRPGQGGEEPADSAASRRRALLQEKGVLPE